MCRMECEETAGAAALAQPLPHGRGRVLRLFDMAQIAAARVVDVRSALPLLQFAHYAHAKLLQDICIQVCPCRPGLPPRPAWSHRDVQAICSVVRRPRG